jgi:hypothetical protein
MSAMPRLVHRRVIRRWMVKRLGGISKRFPLLSFPEFCIMAERIINPDKDEDVHHNFSENEAILGYMLKLDEDQRQLLLTPEGTIDRNTKHDYHIEVYYWNRIPRNALAQLYTVDHIVTEYEYNGHRHRIPFDVYWGLLQTLRGRNRIRPVDNHLNDSANGIDETRSRIAECIDIRRVDRFIDQLIAEFNARR